MSNFSDPLISKTKAMVTTAKSNAQKAVANAASSAVNQVKSKALQSVSKLQSAVESKLKKGVSSALANVNGTVSKLAQSVSSKLTGVLGNSLGKAASGFLGSLFTKAGKTANFAETAFTGKPTDVIAAKDVYGLDSNAVVNNVSSELLGETSSKINEQIKGLGNLSSDMSSIVKQTDGTFKIDADGLTKRLTDALGGNKGAFNGLGTAITSSLKSSLNTAANSMMTQFTAKVNNTITQFTTKTFDSAKGLFGAVNQITGSSSMATLIDKGAETQLLTGLYKEAIDLQVPEIIDVLNDNAQSSIAANQALINITNDALQSGNVQLANSLVNKLGSNQILAIDPNATSTLLSNYTLPTLTKQSDLQANAVELIATLNSIDAEWLNTSRNGEPVSNLSSLSTASDDAVRVLSNDADMKAAIMMAQGYENQTYLESALEKYPMLPVV